MKILYIITQGESGGAQKYVFDLATNLANNFEVTVAVGEPGGARVLQEKLGELRIKNYELRITVVQLRHLVRNISLWQDILAIFELAKLYKDINPGIVHLNSTKAGIIGSIAKVFTGNLKFVIHNLKLIYTAHGWVFNEQLPPLTARLYKFLEKFTAKNKDKIIVLSDFDAMTGEKAGIPADKLIKIPLGITPPSFMARQLAREALAKMVSSVGNQTNFIVGTVANLYATKGLHILIEAINKIKETAGSNNLKFLIIGEGPERNRLQSLIQNYHLADTVFLPGAIADAAGYLSAFDLFVLPSLKEGLPYTILEAMAAGVPIIATGVGGIPALIDDTTGKLIAPNDSEQLAGAILWALKNPEETKNRAERAREKIKNYSLEKMLSETKDVYESMITC